MKFGNLVLSKNLNYVLIGIILIFIAIFTSQTLFAADLDNIDLVFDKEYYEVLEDSSIVVSFEVFNNNSEEVDFFIYSDCDDDDDDEISCDYSNNINLSPNSSRTQSFYINGNDDGRGDLDLYIRDSNDYEVYFSIDVEVIDDIDEGDFAVDVQSRNLCVGRENSLVLEIDNSYNSNLYYLNFKNNPLSIYKEWDNPIYLPKDDKDVEFLVYVPESIDTTQSLDVELLIENEEVSIVKEISLNFRNCQEDIVDFAVSGSSYQSYILEKEIPKTITYNVVNNSNMKKTIYVSEYSSAQINVDIEDRQLEIAPNSSKRVDVTYLALGNVDSGDYDVNLGFFDGLNSIDKKIVLKVDPEFNLSSRLLQVGTIAFDMGKTKEIQLFLENKGDISEDFEFSINCGNDIDVLVTEDDLRLNPNQSKVVVINLSSGSNTIKDQRTVLDIVINGLNSNYTNHITRDVLTFRDNPPVTLDFLSIPELINIDSNQSVDFEIKVFNFYNKDLVLESIELRGLPQEITYNLPINVNVRNKDSAVISGSLVASELEDQKIDAEIVFISKDGGVLTKPISIIVGDYSEDLQDGDKEDTTKKTFLTGLMSFRNSIFIGIILVCLIVILLYITKVINKAPLKVNY